MKAKFSSAILVGDISGVKTTRLSISRELACMDFIVSALRENPELAVFLTLAIGFLIGRLESVALASELSLDVSLREWPSVSLT